MTARWFERPMLAFDTETTGVDTDVARIVTATAAYIDPAARTVNARTWLVDPGVPIPAEAAAIHGVTTERARADGRPAADAIPEIAAHLLDSWAAGVPLVAFNAAFDLTLLDREVRRHLHPDGIAPGLVLDPMVIDKHVSRRKGPRRLGDVCVHYRVALDGAHDSTADAVGAARVLWRIGTQHPEIGRMDVRDLHQRQVTWRREQADSLRAFWRRKNDARWRDVDGSWPVRPLLTEQEVA